MKYVVVIALIGLLLFLLFRKLGPYLAAAKDFVATLRDLKSKLTPPASSQSQPEKLLRCDACGTWVPSGRMLTAKTGKMFCSRECVTEQRVK